MKTMSSLIWINVLYRIYKHKSILLMFYVLFASIGYIAAQNHITGTVKDSHGEPLIGASVLIKDGDKRGGTVTDIDGNFNISANQGAILEISYVGYETQIVKTSGRKTLNLVLLQSDKMLDDIVVVGYGTQKKVNLTGSVAQVNSDVLQNKSTSSVTQMLQGVMPNVSIQVNTGSPGAGGTISIRGIGSVNSSSPLILVDGVPGSIDQINPQDIESISVLKDAASGAIYGARAAFGVIVVTTKKAKSGQAQVSYDGYVSWSKPTASTDFITCGYDHAKIYDTSYIAVGGSATGYSEDDYAELYARKDDKTENPERPWIVVTEENGKRKYNYYGNFDWWNWMYKKSMLSHSHNVNISGGTDKFHYFVSGSYYNKEGLIKIGNEDYRKYTFRAKMDAQVKPWLRLGVNTAYFDSSHEYPGENASNAAFARTMINCAPYYMPIGLDGNYTGVMKNGKILGEARFADICGGVSKGNIGNRRFSNTFSLELNPCKQLTFNVDYVFGFTMDDDWKRQGIVRVSTGYEDETQLSTTTAHKTDYYSKTVSFNPSHVFNAYGSYKTKIADKHDISFMLGINYEKQQYHQLYGYRSDVMSEVLNDLNLANGTDIKATGGASAYELFGSFYRINYGYLGRYLVELNGRYDGSSRFPDGNRYGFFPSVSVAWRVSEESFLKNLDVFDNLKLRASYGILGNQLGVANYPFSTIDQKLSSYIINNELAYYLTSPKPVSGDYTWEKVKTYNFGIDFSLLKNRLNFTADYFIRNTYDMFVNGVTLPAVFGASAPRQNAGEMRTNGYEVSLSWRDKFNLIKYPFTYEIYASLGDATSKITKYQGNDSKSLTDYYEGMKLGEIWGYTTDGLFASDEAAKEYTAKVNQNNVSRDIWTASGEWAVARGGDVKFKDIDNNNVIDNGANTVDNHGDLKVIGNTTPRYNYGFGTNMSWFGFDFSISFQGIGKRDLYPNKEMEKFWGSWGRVNSAFLPKGIAEQAWSESNPNGYFPRLERGSAAYKDQGQLQVVNDRYLQNLAYLRLKNLTIGYTLPKQLLQKIKIDRLRFYLSGENLCYWSPFHTDYIDPEQAISASDARIYPFSKSLSMGINVSF